MEIAEMNERKTEENESKLKRKLEHQKVNERKLEENEVKRKWELLK